MVLRVRGRSRFIPAPANVLSTLGVPIGGSRSPAIPSLRRRAESDNSIGPPEGKALLADPRGRSAVQSASAPCKPDPHVRMEAGDDSGWCPFGGGPQQSVPFITVVHGGGHPAEISWSPRYDVLLRRQDVIPRAAIENHTVQPTRASSTEGPADPIGPSEGSRRGRAAEPRSQRSTQVSPPAAGRFTALVSVDVPRDQPRRRRRGFPKDGAGSRRRTDAVGNPHPRIATSRTRCRDPVT